MASTTAIIGFPHERGGLLVPEADHLLVTEAMVEAVPAASTPIRPAQDFLQAIFGVRSLGWVSLSMS
jgi:hypothetical protein